MTDYIHGSSDEREVERLEKQARFVAPLELGYFDASPGHRVLDLATGVGAMAEALVQRFPGIHLVGLELRESQLRHARARHPVAEYVQGDAAHMPFPDAHFDRVHCSWLLEHVKDPVAILREVRRVLRPGGYCQFIEVDNATFGTTPALSEVAETMEALNRAQAAAGGDPFVGRRLEGLMRQAGFFPVRVFHPRLVGSARDPSFFRAFVEEFAEIFEGLDEALGPELALKAQRAGAQLRGLLELPGAELRFQNTIAQGVRSGLATGRATL